MQTRDDDGDPPLDRIRPGASAGLAADLVATECDGGDKECCEMTELRVEVSVRRRRGYRGAIRPRSIARSLLPRLRLGVARARDRRA